MTLMKPCTRFHDDGSACLYHTEYSDGWCRQPDCPGFTRPDTTQAPITFGAPPGTAKHIRQSGHLPVADVSVEDISAVGVMNSAIDRFLHHHGGSRSEAEVQLRCMLEDFLLKSARGVANGKRIKLSRDGYTLSLAPDGHTITGYATVHRERTWEQVKSGVKSRFRKPNARQASSAHPDRGPQVEAAAFGSAFDPQTVYLSSSVRTNYAKKSKLQQVSDEDLDAAIRTTLAGFTPEEVGCRDNGCFEIHHRDQTWLITPDCRSVYGFSQQKTQSGGPGPSTDAEALLPESSQSATSKRPSKPTRRPASKPVKKSKAKAKANQKKPRAEISNDVRDYFDIDRAKDERIDRRPKMPYLGILRFGGVTSAGAPGHGKRR